MTDGLTGVREIFEERITDNGIFKIQSWHRTYEPATPKDWRPICFYNNANPTGLCLLSEFIWMDQHKECQECPFRIR